MGAVRDAARRRASRSAPARLRRSRGAVHVEPCGRASVLAGPLRRAQRERGAAAARRALPADRYRDVPGRLARHRFLRTCHRQGLLDARELPRAATLASSRHRPSIERALIGGMFDRRRRHSLGFNVEQTVRVAGAPSAIGSRRTTGALLNRLTQSIAPATAADDGRSHRRCAGPHRSVDHRSRRRRRPRDGAHDARRRLALPEHRPAPRTIVALWPRRSAMSSRKKRPPIPTVLEWLLDLSDSIITHRSRYLRSPEWSSVVELLCSTLAIRGRRISSWRSSPSTSGRCPRQTPANLAAILDDIERLCLVGSGADTSQGHLFADAQGPSNLVGACERVALGVLGRLDAALLQPRLRAAPQDGRPVTAKASRSPRARRATASNTRRGIGIPASRPRRSTSRV